MEILFWVWIVQVDIAMDEKIIKFRFVFNQNEPARKRGHREYLSKIWYSCDIVQVTSLLDALK